MDDLEIGGLTHWDEYPVSAYEAFEVHGSAGETTTSKTLDVHPQHGPALPPISTEGAA